MNIFSYLQQGHAESAVPYLRAASQYEPHLVQHWLSFLHALQVIGDDTHAAQLLEAAVYKRPHIP